MDEACQQKVLLEEDGKEGEEGENGGETEGGGGSLVGGASVLVVESVARGIVEVALADGELGDHERSGVRAIAKVLTHDGRLLVT